MLKEKTQLDYDLGSERLGKQCIFYSILEMYRNAQNSYTLPTSFEVGSFKHWKQSFSQYVAQSYKNINFSDNMRNS